jgi:hypothetical protein
MSQPDDFVAIDFAPPPPAGRWHVRIAAAVIAVLLIGLLVGGVTQLLLH